MKIKPEARRTFYFRWRKNEASCKSVIVVNAIDAVDLHIRCLALCLFRLCLLSEPPRSAKVVCCGLYPYSIQNLSSVCQENSMETVSDAEGQCTGKTEEGGRCNRSCTSKRSSVQCACTRLCITQPSIHEFYRIRLLSYPRNTKCQPATSTRLIHLEQKDIGKEFTKCPNGQECGFLCPTVLTQLSQLTLRVNPKGF